MEDHLKNKNRLEREWEALCSYQAEPSASGVGRGEQNSKRNRSDAVVVCKCIQKAIVFCIVYKLKSLFTIYNVKQCTSITVVDTFHNLMLK